MEEMLRSLFPDGATDNQSASVRVCACVSGRGVKKALNPTRLFFFLNDEWLSDPQREEQKKKKALSSVSLPSTLSGPPLAAPLSPSHSGILFCDKGLKKWSQEEAKLPAGGASFTKEGRPAIFFFFHHSSPLQCLFAGILPSRRTWI